MQTRALVIAGGISLIAGALAFVGVFSYLAANFSYPQILDGSAAEVLPRLRAGGDTMRAAWAIYAVLPLLLVIGAVGVYAAIPSRAAAMTLAVAFATIGALAMCLGLMRWPSIHWELARAYESAGPDAQHSIAATFIGLNLYLGNYIGEFLGEVCLAGFFFVSGLAMRGEPRFPGWIGIGGVVFSVLFVLGALRNFVPQVQAIADVNNYLLPLWMIVLGGAVIRYTRAR